VTDFQLVAINGKAECGKDHFAKVLIPMFGMEQMSFGDHLKLEGVRRGYWTFEEAFVTKPDRARSDMQQMGDGEKRVRFFDYPPYWRPTTAAAENPSGSLTWVETAFQWAALAHSRRNADRFVTADLRYQDEMHACLAREALLIRIVAPERAAASALSEAQRAHISEVDLDNSLEHFHYAIDNDFGAELFATHAIAQVVSAYLNGASRPTSLVQLRRGDDVSAALIAAGVWSR
jgi:hypothetical protein